VLRDGCPLPQKKAVEIKERKYEVRINTKQLFKKTTQVVVTDTVNV
jgi:hypothetical protein